MRLSKFLRFIIVIGSYFNLFPSNCKFYKFNNFPIDFGINAIKLLEKLNVFKFIRFPIVSGKIVNF
jgi:hypothetical protein